jgi:hypothetical protein
MVIRIILKIQLLIALFILFICTIITKDINAIISTVIGNSLIISLTILNYYITLRNNLFVLPKVAIKKHKIGALYKFIINIIAFACIYMLYKNCDYLWLFIGYITTQLSFWILLLWNNQK